ncbi:MAG: HD domain-containing protein, partial [Gammaproteobacteria bacterium]|nr:HD domain-containing protein [Gammaproteobacteria bacterium]
RGHSERVSRMCLYMAEYLGLIEVDKKNLEWAAILHDVGKIGVPESILCKEGPLDGDEYEIIKQHPLKGREILEHIEQFRDVLPGVLHHHESYDGSGYPNGLKGEGIPLCARIISIVDTFDSITTNRPYRQRNGDQKALSVIEELAGTQFDPYLVDKFKEVYMDKIVLDKVE